MNYTEDLYNLSLVQGKLDALKLCLQDGYVDVAEELLCAGADLAVKTKVSSHKHAVLPGTTVM